MGGMEPHPRLFIVIALLMLCHNVGIPVRSTGWAMTLLDLGLYFRSHRYSSPIRKAAMNASCGMLTLPYSRIRALPFFCLSSSLRLRLASPP